jgi:hypothetical protein
VNPSTVGGLTDVLTATTIVRHAVGVAGRIDLLDAPRQGVSQRGVDLPLRVGDADGIVQQVALDPRRVVVRGTRPPGDAVQAEVAALLRSGNVESRFVASEAIRAGAKGRSAMLIGPSDCASKPG